MSGKTATPLIRLHNQLVRSVDVYRGDAGNRCIISGIGRSESSNTLLSGNALSEPVLLVFYDLDWVKQLNDLVPTHVGAESIQNLKFDDK